MRWYFFLLVCLLSVYPVNAQETPATYRQVVRVGLGTIQSASWRPDGKAILVNSSLGAWLYSSDFEVLDPIEDAQLEAFSPSGKRLAAANMAQDEVVIRDAQNGILLRTFKVQGEEGQIMALALSPDDRQIAIGSYKNVSVFEIDTGQRVFLLPVNSPIITLTWKPDGQLLAVGRVNQLDLIDPFIWKTRATLPDVGAKPLPLWSPNGLRLAILAAYPNIGSPITNTLKVWDTQTFQLRLVVQAPYARTFAWSPDGVYLVAGYDDYTGWPVSLLYSWNAQTGEIVSLGFPNAIFHKPLLSVEWSPDGKQLLIAGADNIVRRYAWLPKSEETRFLSGFSGAVTALDWSPDGTKLVSGSEDGGVHIWDAVSGQPITTFDQSPLSIPAVAWSPDGSEIAVGTVDNQIHIWDVATQQERMAWPGHGESVNIGDGRGVLSVAWKPNSHILASGGWDAKARTWDTTREVDNMLKQFDGEGLGGVKVAWSPHGNLLAGLTLRFTTQIQIWNTVTGKLEKKLTCEACDVLASLAWKADGSMMAVGGQYGEGGAAVMLWDTDTATFIRPLFISDGRVIDVDWGKVGQIAALGNEHIYIWDSSVAETATVLDVTDPTVIKWSPDGKRLAVGSQDGTITIWEQG